MRCVTRFEANLLRLLGYFLGREPAERAASLVQYHRDPPGCLGRDALELVKDALAKGCVTQLARRGGWRRERFLRGDKIAEGRLWQRSVPIELALRFSRETVAFLLWIAAHQPEDEGSAWHADEGVLRSGDLLLLFFAHEGLRGIGESVERANRQVRDSLRRHGLCRLAYPEDFPGGLAELPNFAPWIDGGGACILEAMQRDLVRRWVHVESGKGRIADPRQMETLGNSQTIVLSAFLEAVEQAGRRDLARFLLQVGALLLGPNAVPEMWIGSLQIGTLSLGERANTYGAALAFVHIFDRLRGWTRRAQTIGRFDDGYRAAQLWKADWEEYRGDALADRAGHLIRSLDPLRQG